LTRNELDLTFWVPNYGTKFNQTSFRGNRSSPDLRAGFKGRGLGVGAREGEREKGKDGTGEGQGRGKREGREGWREKSACRKRGREKGRVISPHGHF